MKIAITGGTAGIGKALGDVYELHGHEILRLSRRTGHNIRVIPRLADIIESCDMFINNAQVGFAQTELLFEVVKRWRGSRKRIVVVSTMMTTTPLVPVDLIEYYVQKSALELAVTHLRGTKPGIYLTILRPGDVATNDDKTVPPSADVNEWATAAVNMLELTNNKLHVTDISLGPTWR